MGLALGIDYSLFVLSRYREERSRGREQLDAIAATGATASRAVLFSGMTFVLAMFGLVLVPNTIFRSLAAGAILVGIVSVLAALTLLPALLGLLGDRVNARRIPFFGRAAEQAGAESRFWGASSAPSCAGRWSASCSRRPAARARGCRCSASRRARRARARCPTASSPSRDSCCSTRSSPARRPIPSRSPSPATRRRRGSAPASSGSRPSSRGAPSSASRPSRRARRDVTRLTVPIAGDPVGERAIDAVRELRGDAHPARVRRHRRRGARHRRHGRGARLPRHRRRLACRACSRSCSG